MEESVIQRAIKSIWKSKPTLEGAGVHLKRVFGFDEMPLLDPFLLMDDFRSENPDDYRAGFPWHPHRGIETITYVLEGDVEHGDSMGNQGNISAGDVQWMTAGSGIIHQEMPQGNRKGQMLGFQLWANLPAHSKMMAPRYQEIKQHNIPVFTLPNGIKIRIICGEVNGIKGPVQGILIEAEYLDVEIPPGKTFTHPTNPAHTVFAYVIDGEGYFSTIKSMDKNEISASNDGTLILFGEGSTITVNTDQHSVRFLLISGKPLHEPIAWRGPIVMNTEEELKHAFQEYQQGTFIKQLNE